MSGLLTGGENVQTAKHGELRRLVRGDHVEVSKHYWKDDVESFRVAEELFAVSSDVYELEPPNTRDRIFLPKALVGRFYLTSDRFFQGPELS